MLKEDNYILTNLQKFERWLNHIMSVHMMSHIQQHHTFHPSYLHFKGTNHLEIQNSIRSFHIHRRGFQDIGQHFSTFPYRQIMTGRSIEMNSACIKGYNAGGACLEHLGNFDTGEDEMTMEQKETIIRMTTCLCLHFSLALKVDNILYHHWFDLDTAERNDGTGNNKTCLGTNFFGGNTPDNCITQFIPLFSGILPSA